LGPCDEAWIVFDQPPFDLGKDALFML